MKTRQIEMLHIILNNQRVDISAILGIYDISKRTLFYDLESINYELGDIGKIRVENDTLILEGNLIEIEETIAKRVFEPYYDRKERQDRILLSILEEENKTMDDHVKEFGVSKTTIFSDIESIRNALYQEELSLYYNKHYTLKGSEHRIRDVYLSILHVTPFTYHDISPSVLQFNDKNQLYLSDYSMFYLCKFIDFIRKRVHHQTLSYDTSFNDHLNLVEHVDFDVHEILGISDPFEIQYLKAYVLSLCSSGHEGVSPIVQVYVKELLHQIQIRMALNVTWDETFSTSLENHLIASFYRIKFGFPAMNPSLNELRVKYFYLFLNIKHVIRSIDHISIFHKMRDEEIGFVVAYIGGYIYDRKDRDKIDYHKVILVCPQGRAVAHHLRNQIEKEFPNIEVVNVISMNQLGGFMDQYDAIITTLDLPHLNNVIKVQPILSAFDKKHLHSIFGPPDDTHSDIQATLLDIIERYADIHDRTQLTIEIAKALKIKKDERSNQPMLNEVITKERIQVIDTISTWTDAIQYASKPLLEEGIFTQQYVDAMINAVEQYGPYIVLADEFALPHASNQGNVKEVAISLLVVKEPVDLKGKPVKIFMVLATVDNHSHLKALAELTDVISVNETLETIKEGNIDTIFNLFMEGGPK